MAVGDIATLDFLPLTFAVILVNHRMALCKLSFYTYIILSTNQVEQIFSGGTIILKLLYLSKTAGKISFFHDFKDNKGGYL